MIALLVAGTMAVMSDPFVADAFAETDFIVDRPESVVQGRFQDIQFLHQTMPGVVGIYDIGGDQWLYRTERSMPFSGVVRTDFVLVRFAGASVTFQTPDPHASNWMSFRIATQRIDDLRTSVHVRVRVRLVREDGSAIHMLAPLLGEAFISDRMQEDLEGMLSVFGSNVQKELPHFTENELRATMP
jgi:hypothetical protein